MAPGASTSSTTRLATRQIDESFGRDNDHAAELDERARRASKAVRRASSSTRSASWRCPARGSVSVSASPGRRSPDRVERVYVYFPNTLEVPQAVAVNVRGRSFKIAAEVDIRSAEAGASCRTRRPLRRTRPLPQRPQAQVRLQLPRPEKSSCSTPKRPCRPASTCSASSSAAVPEARGDNRTLALFIDDRKDRRARGRMTQTASSTCAARS